MQLAEAVRVFRDNCSAVAVLMAAAYAVLLLLEGLTSSNWALLNQTFAN